MSWAFRIGSALAAIGLLSAIGVFESGGFGPCAGNIWGLVFLLGAVSCMPLAGLFLVVGIFMELGRKHKAPTVTP